MVEIVKMLILANKVDEHQLYLLHNVTRPLYQFIGNIQMKI